MCKLRFFPLWVSLGFFTFILAASVYSNDFGEGFHPAKVKDISDRKYEPAVIELLDNAKDSIVISMYILNPSTEPVKLLLKDLEEDLIILQLLFIIMDHQLMKVKQKLKITILQLLQVLQTD